MFLSDILLASSQLPGFKSWHRLLHSGKDFQNKSREVLDINFRSPLCLSCGHDKNGRILNALSDLGYGYVGVDCKPDNIHKLIQRIHSAPDCRTAANIDLTMDEQETEAMVVRPFSLLYDFVSLFILRIPETSPERPFSGDFTDFYTIIDELLNLRLCFEAYRPVLLSIPNSVETEDRHHLIDYGRLNGIDALVCDGIAAVKADFQYTSGRLPIIGRGKIQEAKELLEAGASLVECTTPSFLGKYLRQL